VLEAGHFAWEEAPKQYGAIVTAWVNGGYLAGTTPQIPSQEDTT
jgi:hypothetical protein